MARISPPDEASLLATEADGDWESAERLEAQGSWRTWHRRPVLVGSALTLATLATVCFGRWGGDGAGVRAATKDSMRGFSIVGTSYSATQTCYGYSGGTCTLENCNPHRNAVCSSGLCVCEAGCSGADRKCYTGQTNTLVAVDFTLTNVKWNKYSMYFQSVSAFGQLKTTNAFSILNLGKDQFSLYKMPGLGNTSRFLLGSVAYPDKVARIASTTGTAIHRNGFYSTDLQQGKGPDQLGLSVCYSDSKKALMFGSEDGSHWAYISSGSWLVYGWKGKHSDVGDGGLWSPDPPFDKPTIAMLPPC